MVDGSRVEFPKLRPSEQVTAILWKMKIQLELDVHFDAGLWCGRLFQPLQTPLWLEEPFFKFRCVTRVIMNFKSLQLLSQLLQCFQLLLVQVNQVGQVIRICIGGLVLNLQPVQTLGCLDSLSGTVLLQRLDFSGLRHDGKYNPRVETTTSFGIFNETNLNHRNQVHPARGGPMLRLLVSVDCIFIFRMLFDSGRWSLNHSIPQLCHTTKRRSKFVSPTKAY